MPKDKRLRAHYHSIRTEVKSIFVSQILYRINGLTKTSFACNKISSPKFIRGSLGPFDNLAIIFAYSIKNNVTN